MLHNLYGPNSNSFTIKVQGTCIPVFLLFLSSTDMSMHKVFVYGTLKKEEPNHHWIADTSKGYAKFLGAANTVEKYPLIIGTKYNIPFLLDARGKGSNVAGEVYEVDESMLTHLDVLEDHPSFYQRELQPVQLSGGEIVSCWIYLLKNFKAELLQGGTFTNYSSSGPHGQPYAESDNEATLEDLQ